METVQLQEQLYQGDYTTVYKAKYSDKDVIVKILKEQFPSLNQIARFNEEYDITNRFDITGSRKALSKQKINNRYALVLEYVEGNTLKEYIQEQRQKNQQITLLDFLQIAVATVKILSQIHENQIIHKDINPKNIIIHPDGSAYIIDFGIADIVKKQAQKQTPENLEALEGTLAYISPEQTGRMNRSIDHRSDLYSFGVSLYELWTNQLPFPNDEDTMEIIHNHLAKTPIPPMVHRTDTPVMLINIIDKLLSKTPEARYQSTYGLQYDLEKCLQLVQDIGQISKFPLGNADFLDRFRVPEKLYGRDTERQELLNLFDTVVEGNLEMMLIGGFSGIGKTALVNEIHKPVTAQRGAFISGKFEQYQKDIPYSAVIGAIADFTEQLLAKPQVQIEQWKRLIIEAVGVNGQVLIDVIPVLEHLLGSQPPVPELPPTETQNRFRSLFQQFIRTVSTPEHPLVIFLDDWQWADAGSIELLKTLLADTENKHLLILCAYRSNEVTKAHPFMLGLDEIRKNGKVPHKIKLEPLPLEDTNELVSDTLHLDKTETEPLAKLISEKTEGNPFFLTQLFTSLYENGDIVYDHSVKKWAWDMAHISNLDVTGNVVELMIDKIRKLDEKTQQILQTASCIGNKFPLSILASLANDSQKNILDSLWQALEEGLVITVSGNPYAVEETTVDAGVYFKFLHDRVEQAAYSLVSDEIKQRNRLTVGRNLLNKQSTEYIEEFLFDIVNYLNAGRPLMVNEDELIRLAELNFRAGQKAKKSTAYNSAISYFNVIHNTISENQKDSNFWFAYYRELGECQYMISSDEENLKYSASLLDKALYYANSNTQKTDVYILKIMNLSYAGNYPGAVGLAFEAVQTLFNADIPALTDAEAIGVATGKEIGLFQENMTKYEIEDLENLSIIPKNTDYDLYTKLLGLALPFSVIGVPDVIALIAYKMVNMSIQHGINEYTPLGYVCSSIILSAGFKDYNKAYRFAVLASKLNEIKVPDKSIVGKITHIQAYFLMLREHLDIMASENRKAYQQSIEAGDLTYATFGLQVMVRSSFHRSLNKNLDNMDKAMRFFSQKNDIPMILLLQMMRGFVMNLKGQTSSETSFSHTEFDEKVFIETFTEAAPLFIAFIESFRIRAYTIQNHWDLALPIIKNREFILGLAGGLDFIIKSQFYFYAGITLTALYKKAGEKEQTEYLKILEEAITEIKLLNDECEINFNHQYLTLLAQKAQIEGDFWKAIALLDEALEHSKKHEFLQHEAVINELIGKLYLQRNKSDIAGFYLKTAHYVFKQWGASAKVRKMESTYPEFFNETIDSGATVTIHPTARKGTTIHSRQGTTSTVQSLGLDFQTIIKASQAISSEVKLDTLLSKMLDIIIENAGAGRGVIVRPLDNKFHILADRATEESRQINTDAELKHRLPLTLIRYVTRSENTVVLDDAREDKTYGADTYVIQNDVKSVLCIPVIQQGKVSILIYLENKLVDYVFTSGRVNTLNLLMGQVAVSFENALLYDNMEQEIEKQTSEIKDKSSRITASIQYAQNIQNAILPSTELLNELYDDHYVLYLPKDIVSGDFYWARKTKKYIFTAVVDCTGHGVPGAFMSMIGKTLLDEILSEKGIDEPAAMLLQLHQSVRASLRQAETDNDDGMDLGLIRLEYQNNGLAEVVFSGAKRPLFIVSGKEFMELKGDRKSIGGHSAVSREFTNKTYPLKSGDMLYLLSDGITDVASPKRKMFGKKRVRELIRKYAYAESLKQQGQLLHEAMKAHKQNTEQRDDITVMGVRIK